MKTKIYIVVLCCTVFSLKLVSQIYHAGDITFTWVSGYTYKIKLTNFSTIGNPSLYDPCEDTLCSGLVLSRSNGSQGPCSFANMGTPLNANIKMNVYEGMHTFAGPGNYIECVDDINRNPNIVNIPNSLNQSMHLESFLVIPTFATGKNSSPVFTNIPMASGCLNAGCFTYNPGAFDAEGDSLSYEILTCQGTLGNIPGYSFPYPGSAGTFSIDPVSGTVSWCGPQTTGDYNVVIKISEWRKNANGTYFLVGYVKRDTQFALSICTGVDEIATNENQFSVFPNPVTQNLTISFNQNTTELFNVELTDVMGRRVIVIAKNINLSKEKGLEVTLENVEAGVYFLKLSNSKNTITKKIIKQ